MAVIASTNLKWYLSGTTSNNTNPALAIGGSISTATVTAATLFDDVTGDEASAGEVYYRCVFIKNEDANANGWQNAKAWLSSTNPQTGETIALAVGAASGTTAPACASNNEHSAPSGPSFATSYTTKAVGLALNDATLSQNEAHAIWLRRSIGASTGAVNNDTWTLYIEGDSTA